MTDTSELVERARALQQIADEMCRAADCKLHGGYTAEYFKEQCSKWGDRISALVGQSHPADEGLLKVLRDARARHLEEHGIEIRWLVELPMTDEEYTVFNEAMCPAPPSAADEREE